MSKPTTSRWTGRFAFAIGAFAVLALVLVLGVWGTQARIAGAVIASGTTMVENNRQVIQHPDGGIVQAIYARDGDVVEQGQVLLRLDASDIQSELSILDQQLIEIGARIARLRAERDNLEAFKVDLSNFEHIASDNIIEGQQNLFLARKATFESELSQIDEQIKQTHEQVVGTNAQIMAIETQIDLQQQENTVSEQLREQNLIIASAILEQRRILARLEGEHGRLVSQRGQLLATIAGHELNKVRLEASRREDAIAELRDLEADWLELLETKAIAERKLLRMEILAPVSGVIYGSQLFAEQSVLQRAKDIMYITPQDQDLVILAEVSAADVDHISPGQSVSLKFTALDLRFTPDVYGTLEVVSADSFTNETTGKSHYSVEISLLPGEVTKLEDQLLVPGMPVEAYIQTGVRSPLNYLVKPIADYFYRAFRET